MSEKTTTIRVKKSTKERIEKLGDMRDTSDDVLVKLLGETWFLPQLKSLLTKAEADVEEGKQRGHLNFSFADELFRFLREAVEAIEAR